ncbi:class I SAM-dependent methyltransferase [Labilithrix luteola]|nr:class I SAM-dependent methyltransferase [Labilithrix luteola]
MDAEFDELYPAPARVVSSMFWTPMAVAIRAADLLVTTPSTRVLDVGSGVGKFCIVGAAITGAPFMGIEHRRGFVDIARDVASRVGADTAHFVSGTLDDIDVSDFDALYFFNPFEENMLHARHWLDSTVTLSEARYFADVSRAEGLLDAARVGTRVVTYHGFGGKMPLSYHRAVRERCRSGHLELWVKSERARTYSFDNPQQTRFRTSEDAV